LKGTETIDVSDAVGSNIRIDSRGPEVLRITPRLNEVHSLHCSVLFSLFFRYFFGWANQKINLLPSKTNLSCALKGSEFFVNRK
jgi:NADH dehydrogenase/NADH:ubiquinone oxidoreductase subunit G